MLIFVLSKIYTIYVSSALSTFMFTTKSERNTLVINSATKNIGPGQYNIDKSTLKPLCKSFKHEQPPEKLEDTGMLAE